MDPVKFRVREGISRVVTEAQELDHSIEIKAGEVYEATELHVVKALDLAFGVERVPDTPVTEPAAKSKDEPAPVSAPVAPAEVAA